MWKTKKTIVAAIITAGYVLVALFAWQIGRDCGVEPKVESSKNIPSLPEIQRMIGAKPDGVYGPETAAKWDRAVCNQEYAKSLAGRNKRLVKNSQL